MKKRIMALSIIVGLAASATTAQANWKTSEGMYADTFLVTAISLAKGGYDIELTQQNGNVFIYTSEDGDWMVGDLASCILSDMGTPEVVDDEIITVKYSGWVADEENWIK